MVEDAVLPESYPVLEEILQQIQEYHQRPPHEMYDGTLEHDTHGFVCWLWSLQTNTSTLPETIPHELLLAWRNGYANHPVNSTPVPIRRCEDCFLVMPNCTVDGFGSCIRPCPVCGGVNISHKNLAVPEAAGGWAYTSMIYKPTGKIMY